MKTLIYSNLAFQYLILGPNEPIFCKVLEVVKSNRPITKLSFKFCKFGTIKRNVFQSLSLNLSNIQELIFEKASFQDIEAGAFNFISSNVSVVIDEVRTPFKLNQSPFFRTSFGSR